MRVAGLWLLGLGVIACNTKRADAGGDAAVTAPAKPESEWDRLMKTPTLDGALLTTKPKMADTVTKLDDGHLMLMFWSAKHLHWSDVSVTKNETSFALVRKDSDEARGKRLCVSGTIVEIEVMKTDESTSFGGLMFDAAGDIYKFSAVGSTGELVSKSQARFCGIVTGKYDYPNSVGGVGHAVKLVGMFDLPANTGAKPASP